MPFYCDWPSRILPLLHSFGHNWIDNIPSHIQSPQSGSADPFSCLAHSVAAAFYIYRGLGGCSSAKIPTGSFASLGVILLSCRHLLCTSAVHQAPFGAAVLQLKFPLEASHRLVQPCRRVVTCFLRLPYVKRRLGAAVFKYNTTIFFIYSVSSVHPFLPLLFASGLKSDRMFSLFLIFFPCCFDLLFMHCVPNVPNSLDLGLRVFCPVLPVSLPFSRGKIDLFLNDWPTFVILIFDY